MSIYQHTLGQSNVSEIIFKSFSFSSRLLAASCPSGNNTLFVHLSSESDQNIKTGDLISSHKATSNGQSQGACTYIWFIVVQSHLKAITSINRTINRGWICSYSRAPADQAMWWKNKKMPCHLLAGKWAISHFPVFPLLGKCKKRKRKKKALQCSD